MTADPGRPAAGASLLACLLLLGVLGGGACRPASHTPEPPRPQRIVLITIDTLRMDSLLGQAEAGRLSTMPLTLARARAGAWFPRFYSATSSTQPSHASMLTGLHPWDNGVSRNGLALPDAAVTVAELLRGAGWTTAAAVASFPLERQFGLAQGFERYDDRFEVDYQATAWNRREVPEGRFYNLAATMTDRALELLAQLEGERQLLWIHYFDPHSPYGKVDGDELRPNSVLGELHKGAALEPLLTRLRAAYDQDVAELDRQLERLFLQLDRDAERFETHVLFASDHGESFGEQGSLGHGKQLHEEQIVVPFFILSPRAQAGARQAAAGSVDVAATLLALAGVEHPTSGRDLLAPRADRRGAFGMRRTYGSHPVYEELTTGEKQLLEELHFYAVDREGLIQRGNARRLDEDATLPAEEAARLKALFAHFEQRLASTGSPSNLDEESRKALAALGYVE